METIDVDNDSVQAMVMRRLFGFLQDLLISSYNVWVINFATLYTTYRTDSNFEVILAEDLDVMQSLRLKSGTWNEALTL